MYTDHLFGHSNEGICFHHEEDDIQWIRASKLPEFTDDDGDVCLIKLDYEDAEGEKIITNLSKEYTTMHNRPSTLMDACLGNIDILSNM